MTQDERRRLLDATVNALREIGSTACQGGIDPAIVAITFVHTGALAMVQMGGNAATAKVLLEMADQAARGELTAEPKAAPAGATIN